jgi:hypothetical protein
MEAWLTNSAGQRHPENETVQYVSPLSLDGPCCDLPVEVVSNQKWHFLSSPHPSIIYFYSNTERSQYWASAVDFLQTLDEKVTANGVRDEDKTAALFYSKARLQLPPDRR